MLWGVYNVCGVFTVQDQESESDQDPHCDQSLSMNWRAGYR